MAATADVVLHCFPVTNHEGLMHRMARQAVFDCLIRGVWLVAFHTGRDVAVLVVMARTARNQCVFARVLLEFCTDASMAVTAGLCEFGACSYVFLRCMGLTVALGTDGKFLSVEQSVAFLALRHDLIPVLLHRAVGMILRMAFYALDLMLAPLVFNQSIDGGVTAAALIG